MKKRYTRKVTTISMTDEFRKKVEYWRKKENLTMSMFITQCVNKYIKILEGGEKNGNI